MSAEHGASGGVPNVGFVLEQSLGHITHAQNLQELVPRSGDLHARFAPIPFSVEGVARRIPGYRSNWTIRAGLRARGAIRSMIREAPLDALFIHTQVPAVLAGGHLRRIPTVVSLDATPLQYDQLGEHYAHGTGPAWLERLKYSANRRCFERAAHLVVWAEWTKRGLVDGYGVKSDDVTVIAPGVNRSRWEREAHGTDPEDTVRILFVGGDLHRKGGDDLLAAFRLLRDRRAQGSPDVELNLVTRTSIGQEPGVIVHDALQPNSADLIALYHRSHIFCLPTLGDCLPMVLPEAGAAHLALVSTDVGAIGEIVRDDESGYLVTVGDVPALADRLERLVADAELRRRLAEGAAAIVREHHDAERNAGRIVEILVDVARRPGPRT